MVNIEYAVQVQNPLDRSQDVAQALLSFMIDLDIEMTVQGRLVFRVIELKPSLLQFSPYFNCHASIPTLKGLLQASKFWFVNMVHMRELQI